jgi:hypothetical protein
VKVGRGAEVWYALHTARSLRFLLGNGMKEAFVQVARNGFFGVGAPEALLVGVVALVVFGPQGLIDVRSSATFMIQSSGPLVNTNLHE